MFSKGTCIRYGGMLAAVIRLFVLVEAVKELSNENAALRKQNQSYEGEVANLQEQLSDLRSVVEADLD